MISLKEAREKLNYTQQDIANRAGIPLDTYRQWERQAVQPAKARTEALRQVFGNDLYEQIDFSKKRRLRSLPDEAIRLEIMPDEAAWLERILRTTPDPRAHKIADQLEKQLG